MVDVYQQWAGSCKSVEGNFKRIKLETGEPLLKFALVIIVCLVFICPLFVVVYTHFSTHYFVVYFIIINIHFICTHYSHFLSVLVIDVYQTYGGPCKAMEAKFRAIKNTLGDPLLYFVIVSQI